MVGSYLARTTADHFKNRGGGDTRCPHFLFYFFLHGLASGEKQAEGDEYSNGTFVLMSLTYEGHIKVAVISCSQFRLLV